MPYLTISLAASFVFRSYQQFITFSGYKLQRFLTCIGKPKTINPPKILLSKCLVLHVAKMSEANLKYINTIKIIEFLLKIMVM